MSEERAPLLLHSLATFSEEIVACLDAAEPRRIVEIGSETGALSVLLLDWARTHGARLVSVDPVPPAELERVAADEDALELVAAASPEALDGLEPAEVYVVDGDHNYFSVFHELEKIYEGRGDDPARAPLTMLHDLAWPAARRDQYYAPDRIPAADRHPHDARGGVVPGRSELVDGGFRGAGEFSWATSEGGPRNGVLTAVEDVLERHDALRLIRLPCVFGFGVVFHGQAPYASDLAARLAPLDDSALLRRLEENRLRLYLHVLDLQGELERRGAGYDRMLTAAQRRIDALEAENSRLRLDAVAT